MNRLNKILILIFIYNIFIFPQRNAAELKSGIDSLLTAPFFQSTQAAIEIYDLTAHHLLYKKNEKLLLTPASNMKILTTAAALFYLGHDYQFQTSVCYTGNILNRILYGDLYLIGGGDPLFNMQNLDSLINSILPSSAVTKRMSKEFNSKSSGEWYSFYRFAEAQKNQYQILSIDTTIDIDTLHIALRFEEKGTRLADETIHTKAGDFNCKKFLVQKIVNYLLFDILPVPLLTENDTIWIAQDRWIVKDVVPTTKLDLSTFGFGKQYFPGYKQVLIPEIPTGVNENKEMVSDFRLYQNYPNPFNPSTIIKYSLSANSDVSLTIYDIMGKEIVTLVNKKQNAGNYEVNFNPSKINNGLSSGVYFYRISINSDKLKAGTQSITKKLLYLK